MPDKKKTNVTKSSGDVNSSDTNPNVEKAEKNPDDQNNIIVVGDWFVDEHWVTGIHRSSSASRTGMAHHRVIQNMDSQIESFCGAGRTASLLYNIDSEKIQKNYSIYGIGIWHEHDKETLKNMFEFTKENGHNHHRLSRQEKVDSPENVHLYNLGKILDEKSRGTTRIVRIYHTTYDRHFQFNRVDWELEGRYDEKNGPLMQSLDENKMILFLNEICKDENTPDSFRDFAKLPEEKNVKAIILKDLRRGVISEPLVNWFADKYKNVPWFVSTKAWMPKWLDILKRVNLRVLLIPQVAAHEAIALGEIGCWIARAGYPGLNAMELINRLKNKVYNEANKPDNYSPYIIVLPEGYRVLAHAIKIAKSDSTEKNKDVGKDTVVQEKISIGPIDIDLGMASVFLPALVEGFDSDVDISPKKLVGKALNDTYNWIKYEGERVTKPNTWKVDRKFMNEENIHKPTLHINEFFWEEEYKNWKNSMAGTGVIQVLDQSDKPKKQFQLWRSMMEIDGFPCCIEEKKDRICRLMRGIEAFHRSGRRHHVCCMLVAPPGSGKTFFVKRMSKTLNFRFLSFNITQMVSRSDILDCFDTIVTTQAQDPDRPLLVFVDEINARLDGDLVYNAFLAPIEEGLYVRGGKVFHIAPCVWVFSGTEDPANPDISDFGKSRKGSDFKSRLTLGVVEIDHVKNHTRVKTENIYRAVAMIQEEFPDVRYITEGVLDLLNYMEEDINVREIKNFVKSFVNVQYEKIMTTNIPDEVLDKMDAFDKTAWDAHKKVFKEGDKVEIVSI